MQARGLLMREHRLIERSIEVAKETLAQIESDVRVDADLIETLVDVLRTYADRTHHGKEEDILFRELADRSLSSVDRRFMDSLIADHATARNTTRALLEATGRYRAGDDEAIEGITTALTTLVELYPAHIAKEDETFFPAARAYFSGEEDQALLREFRRFDQTMIHEKYGEVVEQLEDRSREASN